MEPDNKCEGTVTVGKTPFSVIQSTQVPSDGKRHTGEFKNFMVSAEIGTKLEIPISVACGGAPSSTTITIVWKADGELDDAQSDIDGDGVVNKDDRNAAFTASRSPSLAGSSSKDPSPTARLAPRLRRR